jgi:hypothetical protein
MRKSRQPRGSAKFHLMLSEKSAKPLELIRNLVREILSRGIAGAIIRTSRRGAWHSSKHGA